MIHFDTDYMEGAHPEVMRRLLETNLEQTPGYGSDVYTKAAKERIREACGCPEAGVFFLVGGTQTNATVIDGLLARHEGVLAAETAHINVHEAGAIEAGGHKVLTLPQHGGKLCAKEVAAYINDFYRDETYEHMVAPGMVYISHPTELGTLYSLSELEELSAVCRKAGIPLYMDGARLGYALASPDTDVTIYGHTDNTGTRAVNERISKERADAVANFLVGQGISRSRLTTEGLAFFQPVADNSTAEGRAQNRRVEIYITANADMIKKAESGQLN